MSFCDMLRPDTDCASLQTYMQAIIDAANELPDIRFGQGFITGVATSQDEFTALWEPCTPPEHAIVIWDDTYSQVFYVAAYIGGTWRGTGSANYSSSPYYTDFSGPAGLLQEGWESIWVVSGNGTLHPQYEFDDTELLDNPGFEDWTLGSPDDWTVALGTESEENITILDGEASLKMEPTPAGGPVYNSRIYQYATVTEGYWYKQTYNFLSPAAGLNRIFGFYLNEFGVGDTVYNATNDYTAYYNSDTVWMEINRFSVALDTSLGQYMSSPSHQWDYYLDNMSIKRITNGWNSQREFYSAYGDFYLTLDALGENDIAGILFNYDDEDNYAMVIMYRIADIGTGTIGINLYEVSSNVATSVWYGTDTFASGARLEITRDSLDTVDITYDSTSKTTGQALASPSTSTIHGIIGMSPDTVFSEFGFTPE